jgi:hypothetical protein
MGSYPSFLEPGPFLWELSGGTSFLGGCYCLVRAVKRAIFKNIFRGKNYSQRDDILAEAIEISLNPRSPLGPQEKLDLIGNYMDNTRVLKLDYNNFSDSVLSFFYPHGNLTPPLNKPINILYDRLLPRSKIKIEVPRPARRSNLKNQGAES